MIDQTPGNFRALRNLNSLFVKEMDRAGLPRLLEAFVEQFHGQLPYLQDTLKYLSDQMKTPLPKWKPSANDLDIMSSFQMNALAGLRATVESAAGAAMTRGMFSMGGLKFSELVAELSKRFDLSIGQARTLGDTSMSLFYATATDRAYQTIEKDLPGEQELTYEYSGPDDKLTREFCEHLLAVGKSYTRSQIGRMSNGQLPNVFITRGGWNCRHQWDLSVEDLQAALAA
jgi:hypothetical protein